MLQFEEYKVKLNNLAPTLEELRGGADASLEELFLELVEEA